MKFKNFLDKFFDTNKTVIPVVRLSGVISANSSRLQSCLSLASAAPLLKKAFSIKQAPVVVITINSPGGAPVQSRLINSRIRELADEKNKKVLVFVEDVAASGGYMIALAGDEIIADETSIVGSIGVIAATFGFDKAIKKLGIERRVYTAGKNKVSLDPFQPEKPSDITHLKSLQRTIHEVFIEMVKQSRADKLQEHKDMFTGMYWTGEKAKELGLIDETGHMSSTLKKRYGNNIKLRLIESKTSIFSLSGLVSAAFSSGAVGITKSIEESVEERALWSSYGL